MTVKQDEHHLWKASAQEHFHRWADRYDRDVINILLFRPSYQRVLAQLRHMRRRGLNNLRMLDIGCGTGTLLLLCLRLYPLVKKAVGLDMSDKMIAHAREKFENLGLDHKEHLTIGDAEHLPYDDNSFDVVTCCNSFHHYPHKEQALREMRRVLDHNGRLILIDGSRDDPFGYFIFEVCVAYVENHVHHCSREKFHELLTKAGFSDIVQNIFGVCPPALINVARVDKR